MDPQYLEVDGNIGPGRFLVGMNDHNLSNEEVVLDAHGADVWKEGRIMAKRTRGAQGVTVNAAPAGFVGNGVFSVAPTADAGIDPGDYTIVWLDADTFEVRKPDGVLDKVGQNGAAYNGAINFTYTTGATPNAAGDTRSVTVAYAAANGRWCPVDPAAVDGTQIAAGLLYARQGKTAATLKATMVCRHQVVNGHLLDFGALSSPQKAVAEAQLAAQGIIVRY